MGYSHQYGWYSMIYHDILWYIMMKLHWWRFLGVKRCKKQITVRICRNIRGWALLVCGYWDLERMRFFSSREILGCPIFRQTVLLFFVCSASIESWLRLHIWCDWTSKQVKSMLFMCNKVCGIPASCYHAGPKDRTWLAPHASRTITVRSGSLVWSWFHPPFGFLWT